MTLPPWVPSGQLKPAPQPLLLVQAFVNTKDFDLGTDLLAEPGSAGHWLHQAGLLGAGVTAGLADLRTARAARESIRVLLARNAHGGDTINGEAAGWGATDGEAADEGTVGGEVAYGEAVDGGTADGRSAAAGLSALLEVARAARPELSVGPDGEVRLGPGAGGGLGSGLTRLLLIIRDTQQDGTWRRLKICGKADCQWAFYDRSHSRAGTWCDMASCGNLIKNRNLRARRGSRARSAAPAQPARP